MVAQVQVVTATMALGADFNATPVAHNAMAHAVTMVIVLLINIAPPTALGVVVLGTA